MARGDGKLKVMKSKILIFTLLLLCPALILGQERSALYDSTVNDLVRCVKMLKDNPDNYSEAAAILKRNAGWTLMNEIEDTFTPYEGRCRMKDKVEYTNIVSIGNGIERQRANAMTSISSFLNGNSPNYNHSIYELMVKAGATVSFTLRHRQGPQLLLVIPYSAKECMAVSISCNGVPVKSTKNEDGSLEFIIENVENQQHPIEVCFENTNAKNLSAVIINHNMSNRKSEK